MTLVAGADITKGRWVVVALEDGRFDRILVAEHLIHLRQRLGPVDILALDIPIGLPESGDDWPRQCDVAAKNYLGPLRASVFLTPPRRCYDTRDYARANALHRKLTGKGLSKQTWSLRDRILEAEFSVGENLNTIEVHPEVSFRALKCSPLTSPKKSWNGQMERRSLLHKKGIEIPNDLGEPGKVPPDDILDAAAAAWTAWRVTTGEANVFPESAIGCARDRRGVIWY